MTAAEFWFATLRDVNGRSEVWRSIQRRQDFRTGVVCSTLANIHRDENRRPKPYTPEDFMPGEKTEQPGMTEEDWKAWARRMKAFYGG